MNNDPNHNSKLDTKCVTHRKANGQFKCNTTTKEMCKFLHFKDKKNLNYLLAE